MIDETVPLFTEEQARQRITDMRAGFHDLQDYLREQIEKERVEVNEMRKSKKHLADLQAILSTLHNAEQAFVAEFQSHFRPTNDLERIRRSIGRKIDRIRVADNPEVVFRRAERGGA